MDKITEQYIEDTKDLASDDPAKVTKDDIIEPDVITVSPGLAEGPSPGILEKIASVFRKPKEEDKPEDKVEDDSTDESEDKIEDETKDETTDESKDKPEDKVEDETKEKVEYTEIDPRFVNTAGTYGWSRERIIEYAENHDDLDVVEMTTRMEKSIKDNRASDTPKPDGVSTDTFINEEALKTLAEKDAGLAQAVRDILDPLAKRFENTSSELDTLKGDLGKYESDRKAKDGVRDLEVANGIFDSSGISSLGKTKDIQKYPDGTYNLSDPMVKERGKIWDVAQQFYANGGTFEGAVNNALQWYRGSDANKEMKRKVIKDLKEQEERVMPKREQAKVETEYASEEERKAAVINDAIRKYNVEL